MTLLPAAVTTAPLKGAGAQSPQAEKAKEDLNVNAVFAKLKQIGGKKPDEE